VELRSRGLSCQEIARELQVSKASITSDVQYIREQAKELSKSLLHTSRQSLLFLVRMVIQLKSWSIP
jgi:orotate phosphoribosyltransferase-like protein